MPVVVIAVAAIAFFLFQRRKAGKWKEDKLAGGPVGYAGVAGADSVWQQGKWYGGSVNPELDADLAQVREMDGWPENRMQVHELN